MTDNELELVPSALTIEAGKYYRTSDGRKVGPMVEYSHRRYCEVQGDGRWWDAKGVGCMYAKDINLIAEWVELERVAATIAIVAVIENGQPKPSSHPHMHPTRSAAEAEATRLAAKHLGKEFGVFELVASRKDERQFDHEWQRIAANGNKIGAIKAIRVLTGFGLKAAKDGIEDWLARNAA